jgi:Anticodon binding domain
VFYLIRFALSGNPVGAPMADIAEVIGKTAVEERISAAIDVLKQGSNKNEL